MKRSRNSFQNSKGELDFRLSAVTVFLAVFIIIFTAFAREVTSFVQNLVGESDTRALFNLVIIFSAILFLVFSQSRDEANKSKTVLAILFLALGIFLATRMKIPVEKIHLVKYAFLGYLVMRDLGRHNPKEASIIPAFIFCMFIGLLDEAFQYFLPDRVFDTRDIMFNAIGSVWGIILFILRG